MTVEEQVKNIVRDQFGVSLEDLTRETHLVNDLNADSLDGVEVLMDVEDEFEISIPDKDAEALKTIGQIVDYVTNITNK